MLWGITMYIVTLCLESPKENHRNTIQQPSKKLGVRGPWGTCPPKLISRDDFE